MGSRIKAHTSGHRRAVICILILSVALAALFVASFYFGRYGTPPSEVVKILFHNIFPGIPIEQTWETNMETAVINIRLPRIMVACMVGLALAVAGASYQSVFQNPMAAPDLLGASSGACLGAALAILMDGGKVQVIVSAFVFSLATVAAVYIIGSRTRGSRIVNMVLAGVMISSLCSAGTSYVKLVADPTNQLPEITYWLMGSVSGSTMNDVLFAIFPMAGAAVVLILIRWRMNLLTLGEDEARSMGVNTNAIRLAVIICSTVLTAVVVSISGMIGWVGLVIPHLSRKLVGNDCRVLVPCTMVFGALFLLIVDNVSRNLLATEIPIGILTAVVGAPFFISLMLRRDEFS